MKTARRLPMLAFLLIAATGVQADEGCESPTGQWQSRDAVRQLAENHGWTVRRIKIDDGCYEIHGSDVSGKSFEARIDPVTLKVIAIESGDDDGRRDGEHGEE